MFSAEQNKAKRLETYLKERRCYQNFLDVLQVQLDLRGIDVVEDFFHGHVGHSVNGNLVLLSLPEAPSKHAPNGDSFNVV